MKLISRWTVGGGQGLVLYNIQERGKLQFHHSCLKYFHCVFSWGAEVLFLTGTLMFGYIA